MCDKQYSMTKNFIVDFPFKKVKDLKVHDFEKKKILLK